VKHRPEPGDVIIESGIGPRRRHDRGAGSGQHADRVAEQPVDPGADQHFLHLNAVLFGKRRAQIIVFRIAVPGSLGGGRDQRLLRLGRDAKRAFIGADACLKGSTPLTLQRFRPDEGYGGR